MKVLIVDDEPLARSRLVRLLSMQERFVCVGEAENAKQALELIDKLQPDILLLDIAMPENSGLELAKTLLTLPTPPAVIFVTAHPEHALDAYHVSPADYLLKPVSAERLSEALARVGMQTRAHIGKNTDEPKISYMQGGIKKSVALKDVVYFCAEDKYVRMVSLESEALIEESLVQLEQRFAKQLVRAHRKTLINKAYIRRLVNIQGQHYVELKLPDCKLAVSRRSVSLIKGCLS